VVRSQRTARSASSALQAKKLTESGSLGGTLRWSGCRRVRVDLPWQVAYTPPALAGHTRALGVDWGLNTLLTATVADCDPDGSVTTAGRPLRFDATGVSAKLVRLRRHRELLKTKLDH
jgi:hypothetical protein